MIPASSVLWRIWPLYVLAVTLGLELLTLCRFWMPQDAHGVVWLTNKPPTLDFMSLWGAGQMIRHGAAAMVVVPQAFDEWFRQRIGPSVGRFYWIYPPTAMLLAVPFGFVPLLPGYALWSVGSVAALMRAAWISGIGRALGFSLLLSPGIFENLRFGQNGAISGALVLGGLLLVDRRPLLAGALIGLASFKPQIVVLIPVCLLIGGRWRALVASGVSACALAGLSATVFGIGVWHSYVTVLQPLGRALIDAPTTSGWLRTVVTPFILVRELGAGLQLAYGVQAVISMCVLVTVWRVWRVPLDPIARAAATLSLGFLFVPYYQSYDLAAWSVGTLLLAHLRRRDGFMLPEALLWAWPAINIITPLTLMPLAGAAGVWLAWRAPRLGQPRGQQPLPFLPWRA